MVIVGLTEGVDPENTYVPPHEPVYQSQFAPFPNVPFVKLKFAEEPVQIDVGFAPADVAGTELILNVIVILTQVVEGQ